MIQKKTCVPSAVLYYETYVGREETCANDMLVFDLFISVYSPCDTKLSSCENQRINLE